MPILFFGVTMTWEQVCDLASAHSFGPKNQNAMLLLLRIHARFLREDVPIINNNSAYLEAQHEDMRTAETMLTKLESLNIQEIIAAVFDKTAPVNIDQFDLFCYYLEFLAALLNVDVVSHGACCNFNAAEPFVIGYRCDGGYEIRDEASGPVTIPGNDVVIRIRQDFPDAEFMLLSDMCHRCT